MLVGTFVPTAKTEERAQDTQGGTAGAQQADFKCTEKCRR